MPTYITDLELRNINIENLIREQNVRWFAEYETDCVTILTKYGNGRSCSLKFGFDMFTENDDGTICNSSLDTPHWYLEIMPEDETDEGAAYETAWLEHSADDPFLTFLYLYDLMDDYLDNGFGK